MPPEIVVGIVGVESIYGRQMGNFRVIDALATLAFDFPSGRKDRSAFFKDELESWFVLCKSEGIDPLAWRGSYAGAIGMAQFMPSSFNKYAVDFDGDGHVDLHASAADVIGSVANYLAEFGWKRGLPARFDVQPPTDTSERAALLAPDIVPTFTAAEMVERGARAARRRRSPSTACSRSSSCRTATRRRATSPARATSTRSRATTGRATTRWRCSSSARRCARRCAEPTGSPRSSRARGRRRTSSSLHLETAAAVPARIEPARAGACAARRCGRIATAVPRRAGVSRATSASCGDSCGMASLRMRCRSLMAQQRRQPSADRRGQRRGSALRSGPPPGGRRAAPLRVASAARRSPRPSSSGRGRRG